MRPINHSFFSIWLLEATLTKSRSSAEFLSNRLISGNWGSRSLTTSGSASARASSRSLLRSVSLCRISTRYSTVTPRYLAIARADARSGSLLRALQLSIVGYLIPVSSAIICRFFPFLERSISTLYQNRSCSSSISSLMVKEYTLIYAIVNMILFIFAYLYIDKLIFEYEYANINVRIAR